LAALKGGEMLKITFRAKAETRTSYEEEKPREYAALSVPELDRRHCDMNAFRASRRFGSYANSDLFPQMLRRAVAQMVGPRIRLDQPLPRGVAVQPGFLHTCTIELEDV
jgi:hypothetical protein